MSMSPDPRYWPQEMKKVRSGIPKHSDNKRNCTTNAATKRNISTCGGMISRGLEGGMLFVNGKIRISSEIINKMLAA